MSGIHKNAQGKLCATYKGVEYQFDTIIELMHAISIIKNNVIHMLMKCMIVSVMSKCALKKCY